jgi:hypothetical protein
MGLLLPGLHFGLPDASKFRVFGCIVVAKMSGKLRRKLGEKAFQGVMVGYPFDAQGYRVYNHDTRCIDTFVHVVFQVYVPGCGSSQTIDSQITDASYMGSDHGHMPQSHLLDLDAHDADMMAPYSWMLTVHTDSGLTRFVSDFPHVFVTA